MPRSIPSRASTENFTSLADMSLAPQKIVVFAHHTARPPSRGLLLAHLGFDEDPHDVALLHDQVFGAIDLDLGARPLAEQNAVADLDVDRNQLAQFIASARPDGDDLTLLRLLLGSVGDDDAGGGSRLGFDAFDHDAIVERTELHWYLLSCEGDLSGSCSHSLAARRPNSF